MQFHGSQRTASGQPRQSTTQHSDSAGSVHAFRFWDDDAAPARGAAGRAAAALWAFFEPRFDDAEHEAEYQKQAWYSAKPLALWAALFLYLNWALYLGLNRSVSTYEKGVFYGGLSLVTLPVPFMIVKNWPRTCVSPRALASVEQAG
jgi:hypothetical protein